MLTQFQLRLLALYVILFFEEFSSIELYVCVCLYVFSIYMGFKFFLVLSEVCLFSWKEEMDANGEDTWTRLGYVL